MPQLLVRNVPENLVQALKQRARENGRSAEAEHRAVLEQVFGASAPEEDAWAAVRRLREATRGRQFTPSEVLIREARDER